MKQKLPHTFFAGYVTPHSAADSGSTSTPYHVASYRERATVGERIIADALTNLSKDLTASLAKLEVEIANQATQMARMADAILKLTATLDAMVSARSASPSRGNFHYTTLLHISALPTPELSPWVKLHCLCSLLTRLCNHVVRGFIYVAGTDAGCHSSPWPRGSPGTTPNRSAQLLTSPAKSSPAVKRLRQVLRLPLCSAEEFKQFEICLQEKEEHTDDGAVPPSNTW